MNTKFDVGQRVTYPVVHTADGNITGIAVSKAGVTRYAIGPKWYTEDDLKLTAEENPVTEPVKESEPEPVKLYCVKSKAGDCALTKSKIYEFDGKRGVMVYDNCTSVNEGETFDAWKKRNFWAFHYLVPLVRRPAKVGEWVYVTGGAGKHAYTTNRIYKVFQVCDDFGEHPNSVFFDNDGRGCVNPSEYFVLDGYTGDPA